MFTVFLPRAVRGQVWGARHVPLERSIAVGQWWRTPFIPALRKQRQVALCEYNKSLVLQSKFPDRLQRCLEKNKNKQTTITKRGNAAERTTQTQPFSPFFLLWKQNKHPRRKVHDYQRHQSTSYRFLTLWCWGRHCKKQAKTTYNGLIFSNWHLQEYTRNGTKKFKKSYGKLACTSYRKETF